MSCVCLCVCVSATAVASTMVVIVVPRLSKGHSEDKILVCSLIAMWPTLCDHTMDAQVCMRTDHDVTCKQTPDMHMFTHTLICTCSLTHRVAQIAKLARDWIPMHGCDAKCKFPNYKGDGNCNDENKCYLCV